MKHIIDIDAWERQDNFGSFSAICNSWCSVTTEIDCTEASAAARAAKALLFLYYLYAVVRSANKSMNSVTVPTRKAGLFSRPGGHCIISPIAVPGKTFYTMRIPITKTLNVSMPKPTP